jgi:hypothetical protein
MTSSADRSSLDRRDDTERGATNRQEEIWPPVWPPPRLLHLLRVGGKAETDTDPDAQRIPDEQDGERPTHAGGRGRIRA